MVARQIKTVNINWFLRLLGSSFEVIISADPIRPNNIFKFIFYFPFLFK